MVTTGIANNVNLDSIGILATEEIILYEDEVPNQNESKVRGLVDSGAQLNLLILDYLTRILS